MVLAQERHKVLADNIANIDTPGYRMKDIDVSKFEEKLAKSILRARQSNPNTARLDMDVLPGKPSTKAADEISGLVFHDENNRSVEQLMTELTLNLSRHSQAVNLLRNQNNILRAIISGNA
ncbi:flagellar basal body protein [bacterium]|nr:flagellar basal body protein [bacterium]